MRHGLPSSLEKGKTIIHIHTPTYTLFNMGFIVLFPALSSIILIIPNRSSSIPSTSEVWRHPGSPSPSWGGLPAAPALGPAPLPGLPCSLGPQRLPSPTHHQGQGSAYLWCAGSQGQQPHPVPRGWPRARWSVSASGCGPGWSLGSREHREMPFQSLLSITFQRPSVHRFGWGT